VIRLLTIIIIILKLKSYLKWLVRCEHLNLKLTLICCWTLSGTVFTRLVAPAYTAVRDEFQRRVAIAAKANLTVTSLGGFDTCYTVPIVAPTITFMFSGMNVTLPEDNILIHSTAGSTTCLAMASAPDNVNSVLNVIANMQQQNHRVLYDVPNSRLGVARELCTK